ncbi:MAG: glyceraldehyde 3-phosphate dehydrogenase NAD-binding domain-containing protein [Pseudomonadota bacterium]|nr:glyceraldehyde 3-phosphate dehydrogenase NAD-binding domain-containing protein [Pseudomonadota bacterium]MEE3072291.1 glyceraldehyde 3-phosphate dehydrogenase NAD-binding domain-containing protein [Pseudomonadota bacterium]
MVKVAINGFGRIGRTLLRQLLLGRANDDICLVHINDIAAADICAYLLKYDSVYGPFPFEVTHRDGALVIGDQRIPLTHVRDLAELDLSGVDVVLECTGLGGARPHAEAGLRAGAKAVLVSGPSKAADQTIVIGANDDQLTDAPIVSNASCTTNAIAPLLRLVDAAWGIERAHVSTVHCYTGSQPTVDMPRASFERSRAAAVSMVPTSTSAEGQIAHVLPDLDGRLTVAAVRVPSISVSAIDAVIQLRDFPVGDLEAALRDLLKEAPWLGVTTDACVSTDMRARPESLVLALPETRVLQDKQVRLFGWYDNEWGFSARMLDMVRRMHGLMSA